MKCWFNWEVEPEGQAEIEALLEKVLAKGLEMEEITVPVEISVTITTPEEVHRLNREFRDIDRTTDVLSFPQIDYPAPGDFSELTDESDVFNPDSGECILGDIVLCILLE